MTPTSEVIRLANEAGLCAIASVYELGRLISLAKAEALAEGWQPIETAPKDGEFLVFMPEERTKVQAAEYRSNFKVIGNTFAYDLTKPTHWRPLPPPPKEAP